MALPLPSMVRCFPPIAKSGDEPQANQSETRGVSREETGVSLPGQMFTEP